MLLRPRTRTSQRIESPTIIPRRLNIPLGSICKGGSRHAEARDPLRPPRRPAAFEDYYANRHIPYATDHMPNVIGAENLRVIGAPDADDPPYYRVSWLAYESISDLQAGIGSQPGRAVLADLENFATGGATILICEEA
jgi:uncharacterized protein (TIGR02118 family)